MRAKENPTLGKGEEFKESSLATTLELFHFEPTMASKEPKSTDRKLPLTGSKTRALLDALRETPGREVSLLDLIEKTNLAAVHSGVATLRLHGWEIKNRMEYHPFQGGTAKHSFYRLEEEEK